jgi:hypothetical protein
MTVDLLVPADMSCQWSIFGCGGGSGGLDAQICHRCAVTKELLGKCFTRYEITEGQTLEDIALGLGYSPDFLREINPPLNSKEDLVYRKFQVPVPAPLEEQASKPRKAAKKNKEARKAENSPLGANGVT